MEVIFNEHRWGRALHRWFLQTPSSQSVSASNVRPETQKSPGSEEKAEKMQPAGADGVTSSIVVIPPRVPCGSSTEVFVLLKNEAAGSNIQVEFIRVNQKLMVKPVRWNERILRVRAPDFPPGNVRVNVYSGEVLLNNTQLQYYSSMEEISCLLSSVADPVDFMCQALQVSSVDELDERLSSMLLEGLPTGGFQGLQCENTPDRELHHADVPSLLHFAARYGLRSLSGLLLQCPGAGRALQTADRHGQTPTDLAESHGHKELHVLLKETLSMLTSGEDSGEASVYEMMCNTDAQNMHRVEEEEEEEEEEEDLYAPLGVNDEYDTILNPAKVVMIANRPPAPTPRPESTQARQDRTPYIAQVFNKKKCPQGGADLYSLPSKQAQGRERSPAPTPGAPGPRQTQGPQLLAQLQQRVKAGPLSADDRQEVQGGVEAKQQEKLSHLPASSSNSRADDSGAYDKINAVHHAPSFAGNESRRGSPPAEPQFCSKPLKGQQGDVCWKPEKR
ncbi:B-cell scaffold protein with ankyrin repeats isoform X2 [Salarias fasciatus]|uniref:DBB domain-containing protein n=1 Tax=Salarias fasciatus TaxID=181472 RepID=A0A672JDI9_SALFA|nr:B-cell scaffold protein with ankyrin repeats isoform X2 [Salarias fasciatus]